jgi:uncharacterized protein YgiM (DUF1202 family)
VILAAWLLCGSAFAQDDPMQRAITAYEAGDFLTAGQLWEPLANEGNAQAQYSMAVLYHKGQGRPADFGKALDWYRKAAEQDHVNSLFNLGVAYWEGRGVARNLEDAVQWWRRAAELEYGAAQHNLATAYYLGQGAEQNVEEAIKWFRKASDNGYARADKALNVIENKYPRLFAKAASPSGADAPEQAVSAASAPEAAAATASMPGTDMPADTAGASEERLSVEQTARAAPVPETSTAVESATHTTDTAAPMSGQNIVRIGQQGAKVYPFYRDSLPPLDELAPGSPIRVLDRQQDWLYVQVPGGFEMWVYGRYVTGESGLGTVNNPNVRARPLPSTASDSYPLGTFNKGESVEVLVVQGKWKRVRGPERLGGWIKARDLEPGPVTQAQGAAPANAPVMGAASAATSAATAAGMEAATVMRVAQGGAKIYPFHRETLPEIGELLPNTTVRLVLRQGDWVYVQVPGGLEVWVYGRYVDGDSGQGTVNAADVRARPVPSTARNSYPLGTFNKGESVEVLEVQGKWKKVRAPERLGAWVKAADVVAGDNRES